MAPALGLGALLGVLGLLRTPAGAAEVVHSLRYLRVAVSEPGPGLPRYVAVASVDGTPFVRYDSERGRLEPQTLWMAAGAEPGYWDTESRINGRYRRKDPAHLDMLQIRHNQSGGLHTLQRDCGCELLSDGSVRGSYREGYDGQDFLSFQLGSRSFVAADGAAQIIKRHWDSDGITVERLTNFLEQTCLEVLQKHVQYGQEVLKKKEPPDVQVSGKEEHGILTLSCRAYGFYPGVIEINWLKGDEIWDQETWWGGIVPNSDGTFHSWARIEALPGEREQYRCRVEHAGMPEPGIFAWEPESGWNLIPLVVTVSVIAAIIIIGLILMGFGIWKLRSGKRERKRCVAANGTDMGTDCSLTGMEQDPCGIPEGNWGRIDGAGLGQDSRSGQDSRVGSGGILGWDQG
ncbi:class I histocompatibility antigen, F10 alpha chain-like isoform X3 [Chiroxiphia lanceolata]|uniref:class I histocompatibility antigen, F10 alpha chain-like isoform X3 n=1 Tax=Chiroxiphia lanceolata TaxID=296741 RepID=UPI0013CECE9C|nr:class I histocompatibility antigen, F10 alpha chain-like isoform X3 [Chiroxiphia lanceolata]